MSHRFPLAVFTALVLILGGCASDDDNSSADGEDTPTGAVDDASDEQADDNADATEGDDETPSDDASESADDFSGGPAPSDTLILGGPGGTMTVSTDCSGGDPHTVNFELEGAEPGETVGVEAGDVTGEVTADDSGAGSIGLELEVVDPTTVAVHFSGGTQRGRLKGC